MKGKITTSSNPTQYHKQTIKESTETVKICKLCSTYIVIKSKTTATAMQKDFRNKTFHAQTRKSTASPLRVSTTGIAL